MCPTTLYQLAIARLMRAGVSRSQAKLALMGQMYGMRAEQLQGLIDSHVRVPRLALLLDSED